ncbi:MAG: LysR substrate-binding domain-containing protein [Litoreibacter sp.]|nr:LysR substrate-binding domain-containing protein [Litoreibacter sp.]
MKDAASELAVTPGAVSQQIKSLEEDLGVQLFLRKTRAIELTEEGHKLQPEVTDSFMKLRHAVDQVRPKDTSDLKIYAAGMIIRNWLLPHLHSFSELAPSVKTNVKTLQSWEDFQCGEGEVAFCLSRKPPIDLHSRCIHRLLLMPLASPEFIAAHPVASAQDILNLPLLEDVIFGLMSDKSGWESWIEAAGLNEQTPNYAMTFDPLSADYALDMALEGKGVILGWSIQVYQALAQGRLRMLCEPLLETDFHYYTVCNETEAEKPQVKAFMDWAQKEAALMSTLRSMKHSAA